MSRLARALRSLAFSLSAATAVAAPAACGQQGWDEVLGEEDLGSALAAFRNADLEPWPRLGTGADVGRAARMLELLQDHAASFAATDPQRVARDLATLLDLRDRVGREDGYQNLLLADVLQRVTATELAKALVMSGSVDSGFGALVERLRSAGTNVPEWRRAIERERAEPLEVVDLGENGADPKMAFAVVMQAAGGPEALTLFAGDSESLGAWRLLRQPDFARLMARAWATDRETRVTLPLLAIYVDRADPFEPNPTPQQVEDVLLAGAPQPADFSSDLHVLKSLPSSDVRSLLRRAAGGEIDLFPAFDLSPLALQRLAARTIQVELEVDSERLRQHEPFSATLRLHKSGRHAALVLSPVDPGRPWLEGGEAPLTLVVTGPDFTRREVPAVRPALPPPGSGTRRPSRVKTVIEGGQPWELTLALGLDWSSREPLPLFDEPGRYTLQLRYVPGWNEVDAADVLDPALTLESPEIHVSVAAALKVDGEAWPKIRAVRSWWLLYEPDAAATAPMDAEELRDAETSFARLAEEYPGGAFAPRLDAVRRALAERLEGADADR